VKKNGIFHQGIGPIVFYPGLTNEVIDGKDLIGAEGRLLKIRECVSTISANKKIVIVDGVGYPSVGSVIGVSNGDVAHTLNAPVLLVSRPGIGNAIDAINLVLPFFALHKVTVLGAVWNKIPSQSTYHSFADQKQSVEKYFEKQQSSHSATHFRCYGHIPLIEEIKLETNETTAPVLACHLRPSKSSLEWTASDEVRASNLIDTFSAQVNLPLLLSDLKQYWLIK